MDEEEIAEPIPFLYFLNEDLLLCYVATFGGGLYFKTLKLLSDTS